MKSPINHRLRLRMKDKLKILLCPRHNFIHFTLIPLLSKPSDLCFMTYSQIKTAQPLSFAPPKLPEPKHSNMSAWNKEGFFMPLGKGI